MSEEVRSKMVRLDQKKIRELSLLFISALTVIGCGINDERVAYVSLGNGYSSARYDLSRVLLDQPLVSVTFGGCSAGETPQIRDLEFSIAPMEGGQSPTGLPIRGREGGLGVINTTLRALSSGDESGVSVLADSSASPLMELPLPDGVGAGTYILRASGLIRYRGDTRELGGCANISSTDTGGDSSVYLVYGELRELVVPESGSFAANLQLTVSSRPFGLYETARIPTIPSARIPFAGVLISFNTSVSSWSQFQMGVSWGSPLPDHSLRASHVLSPADAPGASTATRQKTLYPVFPNRPMEVRFAGVTFTTPTNHQGTLNLNGEGLQTIKPGQIDSSEQPVALTSTSSF